MKLMNSSTNMFTKAGVLLVIFGVIGGVAAASRIPVHYVLFVFSVILMLAGILLRKVNLNGHDVETTQVRSDAKDTMSGLEKLIGAIQELSVVLGTEESGGQEQEKQALLTRIDLAVLEDIPGILFSVKNLESGMERARCAGITALISEGERYLNRARSALSDGYVREARDSLLEAGIRLEKARKQIPGE